MNDLDIYIKLATLSEPMKKEVSDFVDFLKTKSTPKNRIRKAGLAKGLIKMHDDFDEPLDDFKEYSE